MLHEILLSLSGHPSPLLQIAGKHEASSVILSPPEEALLASVSHIADLHCKLIASTAEVLSTHHSSICQAVALSIKLVQLARFQQKVVDVEKGILRKDARSVGAYNIVPLTAIVGEFSDWTRRMEWLWDITQFMCNESCTGARVINKLCESVQTGYSDIEETALQLVRVAETAWLKQTSAWILYGRLPLSGQADFCVQPGQNDDLEEYKVMDNLLPGFVTPSTAASILFIGRSLNHIRVKGAVASNNSLGLVPSHLHLLSTLPFPITISALSSVVSAIRLSLSQNALEKLLPLSRISEILGLLHDFFLLRRGEFAISLINEADEKIRSRWRRSNNLAFDKRDKLGEVVIKDGEVSAVLARTWAAMSLLQNVNDDENQLDLARDLVYLSIVKHPILATPSMKSHSSQSLARTPFNNFLLSVPTQLGLHIPSPMDLFLNQTDIENYSTINSYLVAIRRAHLRLGDLWKITSLRRVHPAPQHCNASTGKTIVHKLRMRAADRGRKMRSVWATGSAALFLLGEAEAYFHGEVVKGTWAGFQNWLTGTISRPASAISERAQEDVWATAGSLPAPKEAIPPNQSHDPQTLSEAHRRCLTAMMQDLLLTKGSFIDHLYHLLQQIDHLVALVHRIQSIWQSLDLEADEGVVDAFSDFRKEEKDIEEQLDVITERVKNAIEALIQSLREIDQEKDDRHGGAVDTFLDDTAYVPQRIRRVDRLLMKLDFGSWFHESKDNEANNGDDNGDYDKEVL